MFVKLGILPHVFYSLPIWEQSTIYAFFDVYIAEKKKEQAKIESAGK